MAILASNQAMNSRNMLGLGLALSVVGGAVTGSAVGALRSHWSEDSTWHSIKRDAALGSVGGGIGFGMGMANGALLNRFAKMAK